MPRFQDLTGHTIARLTVIKKLPRRLSGAQMRTFYRCKCECGEFCEIAATSLAGGKTQSCGCLQRERAAETQRRHGMCGTRTYRIWVNMLNRCTNPRSQDYEVYSRLGVSDEFRSFERFLAHLGVCPRGRSLDRINNSKGYYPGNVRWATAREQQRNKGDNHRISVLGATRTLSEWSEVTGIRASTIRARLQYGWSADKAVSHPVRKW